jgi:hypothetical protein
MLRFFARLPVVGALPSAQPTTQKKTRHFGSVLYRHIAEALKAELAPQKLSFVS